MSLSEYTFSERLRSYRQSPISPKFFNCFDHFLAQKKRETDKNELCEQTLKEVKMNSKRIIGILLAIAGVFLFVFANYIQSEVAQGRQKISSAQRQVNQGKSLFSLNPVTKEVGKGLLGGAQKKIDEGKQEADAYELLAGRLQIGGILLFIAGALFLVFGRKSKK